MSNDCQDTLEAKNLKKYIQQISKFSLISQAEEKKLGQLIKKDDKEALKNSIQQQIREILKELREKEALVLK